MGGGGGRLYTYHYTVTTRMTVALYWAAMRAILMFHWLWWAKSQDFVHKPETFWRGRKAEAESSWKREIIHLSLHCHHQIIYLSLHCHHQIIYLSLHCHHQNDFCIKVDSNESHLNVSLIVRDKATRQCPQTTAFWKERRANADLNRGPSACQPNALPLGQTSSLLLIKESKPAF